MDSNDNRSSNTQGKTILNEKWLQSFKVYNVVVYAMQHIAYLVGLDYNKKIRYWIIFIPQKTLQNTFFPYPLDQ